MAQNKKSEGKSSKESIAPAKSEIKPTKKTTSAESRQTQSQGDIVQVFDQIFDNFRSDFEDLLFPSLMEVPDIRVPAVDLENREKDFVLKAEMPGFKKEEIEINAEDDGVEITGISGWKYDQKEEDYICKERACKSFYRFVDLPEEIKVDDVQANLSDGILEITLPKKAPKLQKPKRKITLK